MTGSTLATIQVPMPAHGGKFKPGQPRIIVMHSIECPLERGRALSVAQSMARAAQVSVHYLVDPGIIVQGLSEDLIGWGAGSVNSAAIHIEQSGYAHYTRTQWLTSDGLAQIALAGRLVKDIATRHSIPLRWLTDAELLAAYRGTGPGGLTTHAQCTRVIGGTTHTDPGPNYPSAELLQAARGQTTPSSPEEDDDMKSDEKIDLSDAYYPTLDPPRPAARPGVPYKKIVADQFNYTSTAVRDGKLALDQLSAISKQLDALPAKIAAAIAAGSKVTR